MDLLFSSQVNSKAQLRCRKKMDYGNQQRLQFRLNWRGLNSQRWEGRKQDPPSR